MLKPRWLPPGLAAAVIALLALLALATFSLRGDSSDSLFPLEPGRHWTYAVTYEGDDVPDNERLEMTVDRVVDLGPYRAAVRRDALGLEYYIATDETGIFRVARKTDVEEQPTLDARPRYVLKKPLAVGTEWVNDTAPYLIRRKNEYPRELRDTHRLPTTFRIEALDERVEVPAGRFEHCVRVSGNALVRLYTDPVNGFNDVPLVTTEWYCPGAGLVQFERRETLRSGFMTGGIMRAQLVETSR